MTKFLYGFDDGASEMTKALVAEGLSRRFPGIAFEVIRELGPFLENKIIPLAGQPHPTDPDTTIINMPRDSLRREVCDAFADLLQEASAARSS